MKREVSYLGILLVLLLAVSIFGLLSDDNTGFTGRVVDNLVDDNETVEEVVEEPETNETVTVDNTSNETETNETVTVDNNSNETETNETQQEFASEEVVEEEEEDEVVEEEEEVVEEEEEETITTTTTTNKSTVVESQVDRIIREMEEKAALEANQTSNKTNKTNETNEAGLGITGGVVGENGEIICIDCEYKNKCYDINDTKKKMYCVENQTWVNQSLFGEACVNNFECRSDNCIDGTCAKFDLIKEIKEFFIKIFVREKKVLENETVENVS